MDDIKNLLDGNKVWVNETLQKDKDFFKKLSDTQKPKILWIGCSDSRVPATEITGCLPGTIFVQRNIANLVISTDSNLLSVMHFAVNQLKVKHIIVCGHYNCGGVNAAMENISFGFLDNWLLNIKHTYQKHSAQLDAIKDKKQRSNKLSELNVIEQVKNLSYLRLMQDCWRQGEYPYVHGWVYDVSDGYIKNLEVTINSAETLNSVFRLNKN